MNTYTFLITSIIIVLLPGTGVIYTISKGLINGKKSSTIAAFGCTLGIIPHLIISICFSSLILKMNEGAFNIIKILGCIYLLYLGIGMIISKSNINLDNNTIEEKPSKVISRAVLINLLNPKLTLFFFSFLPQYVSSNSRYYIRNSFILGLLFMLLTLIIFILYGLLANLAKSFIIYSPKKIKRINIMFGIIFILFAIKLILSPI